MACYNNKVSKNYFIHAGVAELADALDLGSSVIDVGVQVLFPAPCLNQWICTIGFFTMFCYI
jgi:hypothetical protein